MDNNLPTDDNQKPVVPSDTQPTIIPETPPATPPQTLPLSETPPVTTSESKPERPTEKPPEPTIEIGSLGQPSLSTFQETGGAPKNKSKKVKTIVSVLGLLLIIASLPLAVILVKQRQEIRKEAETPGLSGSVSLCGITVSPVGQDFKNGTYTFTYSVSGSGQKVEFHAYACACTEGNRGSCGTSSGKCNSENNTLTAPFTRTITAPKIGDCGTYQGDVFILSVNGDSGCYTNR